jgi:hypothetical protein
VNLIWLKEVLTKFFPDILFIDNEIDQPTYDTFECFIYGVGPLAKRDGQNRVVLFKKDAEDWYHISPYLKVFFLLAVPISQSDSARYTLRNHQPLRQRERNGPSPKQVHSRAIQEQRLLSQQVQPVPVQVPGEYPRARNHTSRHRRDAAKER